jgi:hypothetical protein
MVLFCNHLLPASESFLFAGVLFGSWEFFGWGLEKVLDREWVVSVGGRPFGRGREALGKNSLTGGGSLDRGADPAPGRATVFDK